ASRTWRTREREVPCDCGWSPPLPAVGCRELTAWSLLLWNGSGLARKFLTRNLDIFAAGFLGCGHSFGKRHLGADARKFDEDRQVYAGDNLDAGFIHYRDREVGRR